MNQTFQAGTNFNPSQGSFGSGINVTQVNANNSAFQRATSLDNPGATNLPNPYLNRPPQYTADNTATIVEQVKPETSHTVSNSNNPLNQVTRTSGNSIMAQTFTGKMFNLRKESMKNQIPEKT